MKIKLFYFIVLTFILFFITQSCDNYDNKSLGDENPEVIDGPSEWQKAGVENGIPHYDNWTYDVKYYGAVGNGINDDTQAILDAITACPERSALYFPDGMYLTSSTINITKSIVLRGEGPDNTTIVHTHPGDAIYISSGGDWAGIEDLHVTTQPNPSLFPAGNPVHIDGIYEDASGSKIRFYGVSNSWIRNIETSGYIYRHIYLQNSSHCEVRDSYIHNSEDEVVNNLRPNAYGVDIHGADGISTYNLVENNIFVWFRHAMLLQWYCQYNVYGYNFVYNNWSHHKSETHCIKLHQINSSRPSQTVTYTLCEGNSVELVSGGWVHPNNTFFRNRITNSGLSVGLNNIAIGNELTAKLYPGTPNGGNWPNIINSLNGNSTAYGNWITDTANPGIDTIPADTIPGSLYLTVKPSWFGSLDWPPYGGDLMPGNTRRNPAEERYWTEIAP